MLFIFIFMLIMTLIVRSVRVRYFRGQNIKRQIEKYEKEAKKNQIKARS